MNKKEYIHFQLREIKREFLASINDIDEKTYNSFTPQDHWPIAWNIEHCCFNIDKWLYSHLEGKFILDHGEIFKKWPPIKPDDNYKYFLLIDTKKRIEKLFANVFEKIISLTDSDFESSFELKEAFDVSCLRVINHSNSHLRNIWYILGELKISKWSEQSTWIPES